MAAEILSAEGIFEQVMSAARARGATEVEAIIDGGSHALTRFANNAIHQNVAERSTQLSIRPLIDGRKRRRQRRQDSRHYFRLADARLREALLAAGGAPYHGRAGLARRHQKRFDTLEAFVQKEVDSLNQRLKAEKSERSEALKELTREFRESAKTIDKRLSQLDDQLAKEAAALRTQLLEQSKQLTAEIEAKHRALSSALDRETEALRYDKTDREALADLFTEMAMRMKNEFKLPDGK